MKVFNLRCDRQHQFEGWFPSADESERQLDKRLIRCPICDSTELARVPAAPRLNLSADVRSANKRESKKDQRKDSRSESRNDGRKGAGRDGQPGAAGGSELVTAHPQAHWMRALRELIQNTEDVGERFAEEARRIHYREAPDRAIRGVASERERRELQDEGIEVVAVPIPAIAKEPLQ